MRIGIIGTGTIASAVVRGIAADGHDITVSERSAENAAALAGTFANVRVADNPTVIARSDVIVLGLIAEVAPDILRALRFRPDQQVISLMAGIALSDLAPLVAPARALAVMLPFPGIAEGGSPILAQGETALLETLFGARNRIFALRDADELSAYLCAQAVLSPVAQMVETAGDWLGSRTGDPAQGEAFLRMLIASSLHNTPAAALIEALNTEGGYNQRLRQHMERAGTEDALRAGLDRLARDR